MEIQKLVLAIFTVTSLRYIILAGLAFLLYYVFFPKKWLFSKIQQRFPKRKDYWREFLYSMMTVVMFTFVGWLVFGSPLKNYHHLYFSIDEYGWPYLVFSVIWMIFLHDAYFYWTHRAMHHPRIFKIAHLVHHKSTNPSPWAAFAFHPIEAFVEAGIIFFIAFLFPSHPLAIFIFLLWMMLFNVMGHLGWEVFPRGMNKHWLGQWINTSTNHNMHHKYFKGNYGLYFTFWDRWMGTLHPKYHETFEEVKSRKRKKVDVA